MECTTNKSGLGLLFLIVGNDNGNKKIVISRFPADQGIMAEEDSSTISIKFVERVFMKNAHSYKSVLYSGASEDAHFWEGGAIDRQASSTTKELSNYWIRDFLRSDFKTTPKEGTKRLAVAIKNATKDAKSVIQKQELVSVAVLAGNFKGKAISIKEICENFGITDETQELLVRQLGRKELIDSKFLFDHDEFIKHALFKAVELDSGGTLIAHTDQFDDCFKPKLIDESKNRYRYIAEGSPTDVKLRSRN